MLSCPCVAWVLLLSRPAGKLTILRSTLFLPFDRPSQTHCHSFPGIIDSLVSFQSASRLPAGQDNNHPPFSARFHPSLGHKSSRSLRSSAEVSQRPDCGVLGLWLISQQVDITLRLTSVDIHFKRPSQGLDMVRAAFAHVCWHVRGALGSFALEMRAPRCFHVIFGTPSGFSDRGPVFLWVAPATDLHKNRGLAALPWTHIRPVCPTSPARFL